MTNQQQRDPQQDVRQFMQAFGQHIGERPSWPDRETCNVRIRLETEEFRERLRDSGYGYLLDKMRDRVMAVPALCPQHEFLFLTKRADRCAEYFRDWHVCVEEVSEQYDAICGWDRNCDDNRANYSIPDLQWPLPNVHLGFSAEDQQRFDERWAHMRKLAAGGWKLWVSLEPLLSSVDIAQSLRSGGETYGRLRESAQPAESREEQKGSIYFAVIGGESGHGARPCNIDCIRSIVRQCQDAGVAVFVKQLGAKPQRHMGINGALDLERFAGTPIDRLYDIKLKNRKGADMAEWPEDLRIREVPR